MSGETAGSGRVARQTVHVLVLQALGVGLAYGLQALLARWMGVAAYGEYTYLLALSTLAAVAVQGGMPGVLLQFVPGYVARGGWRAAARLSRHAHRRVTAAGVAAAAAGTLATVAVGGPVSWIVASWLVPLVALQNLHVEAFRALQWMGWAYGPRWVGRPLLTLAAAAAVAALGGATAAGILAATAGAMGVLAAAGGLRWHARLRARAAEGAGEAVDDRSAWRAAAGPLLVVTLAHSVLASADLILVGLIAGDAEAGLYQAAARTARLAALVPVAVAAAAAPRFAALHAQGDTDGLQRLLHRAAHGAFWPTLAVAAVLFVAAEPVLRLFGPSFPAAATVLRVLLAGHVVAAGVGAVGYLLDTTGGERRTARVLVVGAVLGSVLTAALVGPFGGVGAAAATAATLAGWNLRLRHIVVKTLGVRPSIVAALRSRPPSASS